jgi:translation initiation factor eIF-2B subunit alpha
MAKPSKSICVVRFGHSNLYASSYFIAVIEVFQSQLANPTDLSVPVAAIQALTEVVGASEATTMSEFIKEVDMASSQLRSHTNNCISVSAGCELFTRYVTRTASDSTEVQ